jgi:transposase
VDSLATPGRKKRRRNFTPAFRKSLGQRACESGISVSQLAQDNGINANMLFKWRRELLASQLDRAMPQQVMLPVTIVEPGPNPLQAKPERPCLSDVPSVGPTSVGRPSIIEIEIAGATVRFDERADLTKVRAVVRMLRA